MSQSPLRSSRSLIRFVVVAAVALSCTGTVAQAQTSLFSDNFNRTTGLGSGWQNWYGSHTTDGASAVSGTPPTNGNWASVAPYLGTQDYSVSATVTLPTGSSSTGLVVRGNPNAFDSDLYSLQLFTDGTARLYRRNAWTWTQLSSAAAGVAANTAYNAQLLVSGSNPVHLEGWLGGAKVLSYDDSSTSQIGNGVPGILNYTAKVKYDNFAVTSVATHLFFDAFTRTTGLGSNWQADFGSDTTDGSHAVSGTPSSHGNWVHVVPSLSTNDYAVSADITVPAGSLDSGLVVRSHTSTTFDSDLYSAQLATDGHVNLFRRNGYTWTTLSAVAMTVSAGTSYHLMMKASGTSPVHLEVWVNGVSKISYDDSSAGKLTTGIPGLVNYNAGVKYSNFAVDSLGAGSSTSTLTVSLSGAGSGTVTSSPSGVSCPTTCTKSVTTGTSVTLTPSAASGSTFAGWGGSCSGTGACTVEVDSSQTVFATFNKNASSGAYPCGASPCARGQFPPGTWRPYGANSAFNKTIPANPSVMSGSATYVNYLLGSMSTNKMPGNFVWYTNGISGWPTYYGQASDPLYSVVCDWTPCSPASLPAGHAPAGAVAQGSTSPDGHLTYVDQSTGYEWDLFGERTSPLPAGGGKIATTYAGYESITGDGRAVGVGQATDGRVGNLAGRIRAEELQYAIANNTYLQHAIGITINCVNAVSVYPADPAHLGRTCSAVGLNNASAPPMGARMWLNMNDAAINALTNVPTWKKVILKTLYHYGAIVMDTGSGNYWDWQFESSQQYISMGVTDVFKTLGANLVATETDFTYTASSSDSYHAPLYTGRFSSSLDSLNWNTAVWSKLQFLNPCVSDGSCNP